MNTSLFPNRGAPTSIARHQSVSPVAAKELNAGSPPALHVGVSEWFNIETDQELRIRLTPKSAAWKDSLVFSCMEFRANKTGEPPLFIQDMVDNNLQWISTDHALDAVLEEPTPDPSIDMPTLMQYISMLMDLDAECLLVKTKMKNGWTRYIYPFSKDRYQVEPANGLLYGKFTCHMLGGQRKVFGPEDVIYLRETTGLDFGQTHSRVEAALSKIRMGADIIAAVKATLRRGVRPSGVLTTKETMTATQLGEVQEHINREYAGINRDGGVFIASGDGAAFTLLGSSLKDLTTGPAQMDYESAICQVFQVHPILVNAKLGLENNTGLADSIQPAMAMYYDVAQRPRWTRIANALTRGLLRDVFPDDRNRFIQFDTSKVHALRADIPQKIAAAAVGGKFIRVNEARVFAGFPELPEDDERGDLLLDEAAPSAFGGGLFGDPEADDEDTTGKPDDDDDAEDEDEEKARKRRRSSLDAAGREVLKIARRAIQDAFEFTIETAAASALAKDLANIQKLIQPETKVDIPGVTPITKAQRDAALKRVKHYLEVESKANWEDAVKAPINSAATASVSQLVGELGLSFDVLQPGLAKFVKKEVGHLIKQISATTLDDVQSHMATGLKDGQSIDQIKDALSESGAFAPSRARLIARTESTRATNGAQRSSLSDYQKESGNKVKKEWLTSNDDRVREEHEKMEGERKDIDEVFTNGLLEPGEPNCRCSLLYSVEEAA